MVLWDRLLRFIPDQGIPFAELRALLQNTCGNPDAWLTRASEWWGYVTIDRNDGSSARGSAAMVRPTPGGRKAFDVWSTLTGVIEARWHQRFGSQSVTTLLDALRPVAEQVGPNLPGSLPILGYGLVSKEKPAGSRKVSVTAPEQAAPNSLPSLLSRVLLAFALEFEAESEVSLALSANVLRFAHDEVPMPVRDLPRQSGVSKEAVAMAISFLQKRGYATLKSDPASRTKSLLLTPKGEYALKDHDLRTKVIEKNWAQRLGANQVAQLLSALEALADGSEAKLSLLLEPIKPYPNNWRASVPAPLVLPHYPMILHRGGFPDGS